MAGRTSLADEGPPETTTIRLRKSRVICFAPLYLLDTLLRDEGFTDIQHPEVEIGTSVRWVERGDLDFEVHVAGATLFTRWLQAHRSRRWVGLHAGCYELFAREPIPPSAT